MAATLLMRRMTTAKGVNVLVPCDALAEEDLAKFTAGKPLMVDVRQSRSTQHHRLLFAMLRKVAQSTPTPVSEDALLSWIKVKTGHVEILPLGFGQVYKAPASISFASMDQAAFKAFFEEVVALILTEIAPNLPETFADEFLAMLEDKRTIATEAA